MVDGLASVMTSGRWTVPVVGRRVRGTGGSLDAAGVRPAGDTCSGARSGRSCAGRRSCRPSWRAGVAPRSPRTCWRLSWLSIAHLRRAGLISMPSRSSRSSARMPATSASGLPLISSVRSAGAGLADGAAAAGEPDPIHDAVGDPDHQRDPVAAQRVGALVRGVGVLDDPEVVGPPIVLEDVVAVQVVHSTSRV